MSLADLRTVGISSLLANTLKVGINFLLGRSFYQYSGRVLMPLTNLFVFRTLARISGAFRMDMQVEIDLGGRLPALGGERVVVRPEPNVNQSSCSWPRELQWSRQHGLEILQGRRESQHSGLQKKIHRNIFEKWHIFRRSKNGQTHKNHASVHLRGPQIDHDLPSKKIHP